MIILTSKDKQVDIVIIKKLFIIQLRREFKLELLNDGKAIKQLLELYSSSEVLDAMNDIYINGNNLETPERGKSSEILRYLEFGGEDVRSMHLISRSLKKVRRGVNVF